MRAETLQDPDQEHTIVTGLAELLPQDSEMRNSFMGRAALVAAEFSDAELDKETLEYVGRWVPGWDFSIAKVHARQFAIARRAAGPNRAQRKSIVDKKYRTPRRLVIPEADTIILMARRALTGSDVAVIFDLEAQNETFAISPAPIPPKPRPKFQIRNGATAEPKEVVGQSGLLLTKSEQQVVRLLALPIEEVAHRLQLDRQAVNKRLTAAKLRNHTDRATLLKHAVDDNVIDLRLLPAPQTYELTDREKQIFTEYTFTDLDETAAAMKLPSKKVVTEVWRSIYNKIGTHKSIKTRTHAYLIARRDGLI